MASDNKDDLEQQVFFNVYTTAWSLSGILSVLNTYLPSKNSFIFQLMHIIIKITEC